MGKNDYVDNVMFLKEIIAYKKLVSDAKHTGGEKPRLPEYVGQCFMLIAQNLSHKPQFSGYTFKEEMIGDAIENCVMYADNFNPKVGKKPFAYFTQIVYYAFVRRIQREKKQLYVKYKSTEIIGILDEFDQMDSGDGYARQFEMYDNISTFIEKFETAKAEKKDKARRNAAKMNLERFIDEE